MGPEPTIIEMTTNFRGRMVGISMITDFGTNIR